MLQHDKNVKLWKLGALFFVENQKFHDLFCFFLVSVTKQSFESDFGFPEWPEMSTLSAGLKI